MTKLGASLKELVEKFVTPNRTPGSGSCDQSQAKKTLTFVHPYLLKPHFLVTVSTKLRLDMDLHVFQVKLLLMFVRICPTPILDLLF